MLAPMGLRPRCRSANQRLISSQKGSFLFEVTPLSLAELLPHLAWLAQVPSAPIRLAKSTAAKPSPPTLLSTGNCKIINLSEENILWGFKI
ncbi:MAG: hypothetical protein L6U61_02770 [Bacteroidales bacterium]|nr:MAG: hypothetical protein L6U61_02770 [Bacteroidales bacterium]